MRLPEPKFFLNTPDGSHCLQSSVKMVLTAVKPACDITFPELFALTGNTGEALTWPVRIAIHLARAGYRIVYHDALDLAKFCEDPISTMTTLYGEEVATSQAKGSDLSRVVLDAKDFLLEPLIEKRFQIPSLEDLTSYLSEGYYCICNVNSRTIVDQPGYSGHFVVVYGFDEKFRTLLLHNPGPPGCEAKTIAYAHFEKAWSYSGEIDKNILAVHSYSENPEKMDYLQNVIKSYKVAFDNWYHQTHVIL